MMAGLSEFFQTIIGTTANVFGVGVTRYDPQVSAGIVTKYNLAY